VGLGVLVAVLAAVALLWAWFAHLREGQPSSGASDSDSCALFDHGHAGWTALLKRYVRDGFVDYAGLKKLGQTDLDGYLRALEGVCSDHLETWSRERRLAFWINAYNAYTVKLILDHYPLKSIRKIGLLPGAAFRQDFISLKGVRGKRLSLNDIEHEILRKKFSEPRIHFGIVCASKGCPMLRAEAYRATDLDRQLDEAARGFVRDQSKNRFDATLRTLHLSSIFKWFREDFERAAKTLTGFVARYADAPTATALSSAEVRVLFLDYDWSLNGR
jgi:hypothetical protein